MSIATTTLEDSVLGAVLTRPTPDAVAELLASLDLEETHWLPGKNRLVWRAMRALEREGVPVDAVTVESRLEREGTLDAVGGLAYLAGLAMNVPTLENAREYAGQMRDRAIGRAALVALDEVRGKFRSDGAASGAEVLSAIFAATSGLDAEQPAEAQTIGQLARQRAAQLERIASGAERGTGFPTGVANLDAILGGWQPGILSIGSARPGMGKSSLGMSTADACSKAGHGVHVFSLEDTRAAYTDRALSRMSGVSSEDIRACNSYDEGRVAAVGDAMGTLLRRKGWLVDDRSGLTAEEVVRAVRRHARENGTKVVIVDYVQLLRWPAGSKGTHEAITANITTLADAAKRDGMAYVVLSQLNRQVEQRADKRPMLADLRESGSLEERAKCVVGLYRGSYYDGGPVEGVDYPEGQRCPTDEEYRAQALLLVLKNSNGRTGEVLANWHGPTTRIW